MRGHDAPRDNTLVFVPHRKEKPMENRTPKNRYNGGAAHDSTKRTDKLDDRDVLKVIESAMDKRASTIAQTVTDMFRFVIMASAMLPNMELDVGIFRLKIDDGGVLFMVRYPEDGRGKHRKSNGFSGKIPVNNNDDEEGLLYDGD